LIPGVLNFNTHRIGTKHHFSSGRMETTAAENQLKTAAAVDPAGIVGLGVETEIPGFVINGGTMAHAVSETGALLPICKVVAMEVEGQ
jgi:hypothetical protein